MKKKLVVSMLAMAISFGVFTSKPAQAIESEWIWEGLGDSFALTVDFFGSWFGTANTFGVYDTYKNQYIELLNGSTNQASLSIFKDGTHYKAQSGEQTIDLGFYNKFYFSFNTTDFVYDVTGNPTNKYLTNDQLQVNFQTPNATASQVPIPGTALLLGSSLLGLLGIGSRKKQA